MLIVLWMTRSITDDIPGWGALFKGRAGDGTVSVSSCLRIPHTLFSFLNEFQYKITSFFHSENGHVGNDGNIVVHNSKQEAKG